MLVIAVDWSGAAVGAARTTWVAEAGAGGLVRVENGRDRAEVVAHLIERRAGQRGGRMVVGMDFGFSFPAWWMAERRFADGPALWAAMSNGLADEVLGPGAPAPFWGRAGSKQPEGVELFRRTETACAAKSMGRPKSVFQVAGAGAVGTGSVRGMAALHALRAAGFAVWPFDRAAEATVIEISPRTLTGAAVKSDTAARARRLDSRWPEVRGVDRECMVASEDAFDAGVSAMVMWERREELERLGGPADETDRVEGRIWWPGVG